jgi:hypothetical protein
MSSLQAGCKRFRLVHRDSVSLRERLQVGDLERECTAVETHAGQLAGLHAIADPASRATEARGGFFYVEQSPGVGLSLCSGTPSGDEWRELGCE